MDDAALQGGGGGLGAACDAELAEEAVDVTLDRRLADAERRASLFVAEPAHYQLKNFMLSPRQVRAAHAPREAFGDDARYRAPARVDGAYGGLKLFKEHVFEQVALRARLKRAVDVFVAVVGREHDHLRVRKLSPYRTDGLDAAHLGHAQVHQHHVRPVLAVE